MKQNAQIMIVEDEYIVAEDLNEVLSNYGFDVVDIADSGEEAVEKAKLHKPDLILMDIMLKGEMNGVQAAYRIKEEGDVPIIYLTAYTDSKTAQAAIETNPSGYLVKPFNQKTLYASVEIALHNSHKKEPVEVKEDKKINYQESEIKPVAQKDKNDNSPHVLKTLRKYNLNLLQLLDGVEQETINQFQMNKLIECCYKLGVFNVRKNYNRIYSINKKWEYSPEDIAIEAISNLFVMNEKRGMLNLKCSIINWNNEINNEIDGLYFLHKTVSISVNQYLNKMLKDSDPFFAKVLDSVNHFIKRYDYQKTNYFGTTYIISNEFSEIHGSPVSGDDFVNLPIPFKGSKAEIILNCFDYISKHTEYFPAVPLNSLVKKLIQNYQQAEVANISNVHSPFGKISIDDIVTKAINKVFKMIDDTYGAKAKLTDEEITSLKKAIFDISLDMKEDQLNWGLYYYLQTHIPELTKEDYKEYYQNILEYLVKKLKAFIKEQFN